MADPIEIAREGRSVRDDSYYNRCDYCSRWSPLSFGRIMGWCTAMSPRPALPAHIIITKSFPEVTAYNQVCDSFSDVQHLKDAEGAEGAEAAQGLPASSPTG